MLVGQTYNPTALANNIPIPAPLNGRNLEGDIDMSALCEPDRKLRALDGLGHLMPCAITVGSSLEAKLANCFEKNDK